METKIKHKLALDFIFGGKSLFTVKNPQTGNRFTFKVKKSKENDVFFVSVLTNSDNKYEYIGYIKLNSNFKHSTKSRITSSAMSVKVFDYVVKSLINNKLPDFIEIWHHGRCARCSRVLTVPESIESGFGPDCMRRKNKK
jgi:hypothetical protein